MNLTPQLLEFFLWSNQTKLIVTVITLCGALFAFIIPLNKKNNTFFFALAYAALMIFRLGCHPIGWTTYGDRMAYASGFLSIKFNGYDFLLDGRDPMWGMISNICAMFCDEELYFIVLATLYTSMYFFACQRFAKGNTLWLLLCVFASMGFISYGVNTLRAGTAISFIVLGLSFYRRPIIMYTLFVLSLLIHFSMIIPLCMIMISKYYNKTPLFIKLWLFAVPVGLIAGGFFNSVFSSFVNDDRTAYLTTQNTLYKQGFRWDFIIYSLVPIVVGSYYTLVKKFKDRLYQIILNAYILTNVFWVLVIRANFTDRFAYLSWFMIPFVLAYPLLQRDAPVKRPNNWLAIILLGEAAFMMI